MSRARRDVLKTMEGEGVAVLIEERNRLRREVKAADSDNEKLLHDYNEVTSELGDQIDANNALNAHVRQLQHQNQEISDHHALLETELNELGAEILQAQDTVNATNFAADAVREELTVKLKKQTDDQATQQQESEQTARRLSVQNATLQEELVKCEAGLDTASASLADSERARHTAEQRNASLQTELAACEAQLTICASDIEQQIERTKDEVAHRDTIISRISQEKEDEIARLRDDIEEYERILDGSNQEFVDFAAMRDRLKAAMDEKLHERYNELQRHFDATVATEMLRQKDAINTELGVQLKELGVEAEKMHKSTPFAVSGQYSQRAGGAKPAEPIADPTFTEKMYATRAVQLGSVAKQLQSSLDQTGTVLAELLLALGVGFDTTLADRIAGITRWVWLLDADSPLPFDDFAFDTAATPKWVADSRKVEIFIPWLNANLSTTEQLEPEDLNEFSLFKVARLVNQALIAGKASLPPSVGVPDKSMRSDAHWHMAWMAQVIQQIIDMRDISFDSLENLSLYLTGSPPVHNPLSARIDIPGWAPPPDTDYFDRKNGENAPGKWRANPTLGGVSYNVGRLSPEDQKRWHYANAVVELDNDVLIRGALKSHHAAKTDDDAAKKTEWMILYADVLHLHNFPENFYDEETMDNAERKFTEDSMAAQVQNKRMPTVKQTAMNVLHKLGRVDVKRSPWTDHIVTGSQPATIVQCIEVLKGILKQEDGKNIFSPKYQHSVAQITVSQLNDAYQAITHTEKRPIGTDNGQATLEAVAYFGTQIYGAYAASTHRSPAGGAAMPPPGAVPGVPEARMYGGDVYLPRDGAEKAWQEWTMYNKKAPPIPLPGLGGVWYRVVLKPKAAGGKKP